MKSFIETSRLLIKKPDPSDFENLFKLQTNSNVMTFIGSGIRNEEEIRNGLKKALSHFEKHSFSLGNVYLKETNEFIGRAGLIYFNYDDQPPDIEVAYALLPKFWGNGYATELCKAIVNWGFNNLPIEKLIAVVHPENKASQNVLEKTGMIKKALISYWNTEVASYEISRSL